MLRGSFVLDVHQELLKPYASILAHRARCIARPAWNKTIEAYDKRVEAA